jgi:hypothetical protein
MSFVYLMSTASRSANSARVGRRRGHDEGQSDEHPSPAKYRPGPRRPAGFSVCVPAATLTPGPPKRSSAQARCHATPGLFRWINERSGCRRAWLHPPASDAGPRWFKSSHPDCNGRASRLATAPGLNPDERQALRVRLPLLPLTEMCPWPSGPGDGLPNRTGGFNSRRTL